MQFSAGAGIARKSARASATACTLAHTSPAIEAARGLSSSESAQPNRPRAGDCSTLLWPFPILRAIFDTRYTPLLGRGVASSWLFSFAGAPVRSYFGCLHFICRTGKSRVLRILSPDDLSMETRPSTQKRTFRVSRLYFLHRCPREAAPRRILEASNG